MLLVDEFICKPLDQDRSGGKMLENYSRLKGQVRHEIRKVASSAVLYRSDQRFRGEEDKIIAPAANL